MKRKYKISFKLFIFFALAFTTLMIGVLFLQSYFYEKTYHIYKDSVVEIAHRALRTELRELGRENLSAETLAGLEEKYLGKYGVQFSFFQLDNVETVYEGKESSGQPIERAVTNFAKYIPLLMEEKTNFGGNYLDPETGVAYDILMTPFEYEEGDLYCLLAIAPASDDREVVGLVDRYFLYIALVGIGISLLLSYALSATISRPLVHLSKAAKDMAGLDFSKKSNVKTNDELGELSDSLNFLSESLDRTIGELTVANKKLENDIERERRLEKTRKEFVANVSHELKTPVAIIKGYAEALKDNIRADKRERYTDQILAEADYMNRLVQDMLDLSKIEAGRYKPDIARFDLTLLTRSICGGLEFLTRPKNIKIRYEIPDSDVYIEADRLKIGQVITNFVTNAIRYSPENSVIRITIQAPDEDVPKGEGKSGVLFAVENDGDPISPESQAKVWDRFFRIEEARDRKTGGTGLGLAISSRILEMHKMEYGVMNTDTGVRFFFRTAN